MKKLINTIIIILAAHLWYCNADLLILSREMALNENETLSTFTYAVLILFALSYSVLSAISVVKMQKYIYVMIFSILDGIAVYMRINIDQPFFLYITSGFYAVYTAYIITVVWLMHKTSPERAKSAPANESAPVEAPSNDYRHLVARLNPMSPEKREILIKAQTPEMQARLYEKYGNPGADKQIELKFLP